MNKSRLGRTLTGSSLGTGLLCDIMWLECRTGSPLFHLYTMDEVSCHCVRTDRHRWNHGRLNELGRWFLPRWAEWLFGTNERIEEQRVERMSRDLISHDPNRGMASRAADSRWDRWVLTKWAATGRGKDEAFVGRGGVKKQRSGDGAEEGGCAGQEFVKKLWSRKEEPAGNLKGKFAGMDSACWCALRSLLAFSHLGWLAFNCRPLHTSIGQRHLSPLLSFSCRLSFSLPVSQNGFPPRYSFY